MNLYAKGNRAFDEDEERHGGLFATQAALILANARAYWSAYDLGAGLSKALESRAMIDMTKDKIMPTSLCIPGEGN